MQITSDLKARIPLIEEIHLPNLKKIQENPHAPNWNYFCGDRIQKDDIPFLKDYEESLHTQRVCLREPSLKIIEYIEKIKKQSWFYERKLKFFDIAEHFFSLPITTRADFASKLSLIIPHQADLSRLVVNPTSGTTGHSIVCPNHPQAIGCYNSLILYSLKQHGVIPKLSREETLAIQMYNQKETAVYCTVKPILNGVGFAKINLNPNSWNSCEDIEKFILDLQPSFFSGNPIGFKAYLDGKYSYKPKAFLSTSMQLSFALRTILENTYKAKVIDFYSLNDTGPLGYSCPKNPEYFHVLPHDVFLEITDEEGNPKKEGEIGYITVTGGRNPYLPLVRYQTGDLGRITFTPCECGEVTARFQLFDVRKPTTFVAGNAETINPIDIGRILRQYPIFRHRLTQKKNLELILEIEPMPSLQDMDLFQIQTKLEELFGKQIPIQIQKTKFIESKILPYVNENENL